MVPVPVCGSRSEWPRLYRCPRIVLRYGMEKVVHPQVFLLVRRIRLVLESVETG